MTLLLLLSIGLVAVRGSDVRCQTAGGACQDDRLACSGRYQSGMCSGAASRRCCLRSAVTASTALDCSDFGHTVHHARGTAYYPDSSALEGGFVDMHGVTLRTLQQFLAGTASYVSVAMDNRAGIAYGTPLCIPEINRKYNRVVLFKVVDTGGAFFGRGYARIDICVQDHAHSLDSTINGQITLVFKP